MHSDAYTFTPAQQAILARTIGGFLGSGDPTGVRKNKALLDRANINRLLPKGPEYNLGIAVVKAPQLKDTKIIASFSV